MIGIATVLMLAAAASGDPSSSPCECPRSIGASAGAPPLVVVVDPEGRDALLACGYLDERISQRRVIGSEFEVFRCGSDSSILTFGALQTCTLEAEPTGLTITELTRWPFGPDWTWVDVPLWEYRVFVAPERPIRKRFVLSAPELTAEQIETTLQQVDSAKQDWEPSKADIDKIEELVGRTLAAALTGNEPARRNLGSMSKELGLDGHGAEVYSEAFEVYQSFANETGKVPPLP